MMLDLVHGLGALDGTIVLASGGDSEGDLSLLGLLFMLSGFVFYGAVRLRYRNADKRHRHEAETEARLLDVRATDHHVDTLTGVRHSRMKGANNRSVRGASSQAGLLDNAVSGIVGEATRRFPGSGGRRRR